MSTHGYFHPVIANVVEVDEYSFGSEYQLNSLDDPASPDATYECVMLEPNGAMLHPHWDSRSTAPAICRALL